MLGWERRISFRKSPLLTTSPNEHRSATYVSEKSEGRANQRRAKVWFPFPVGRRMVRLARIVVERRVWVRSCLVGVCVCGGRGIYIWGVKDGRGGKGEKGRFYSHNYNYYYSVPRLPVRTTYYQYTHARTSLHLNRNQFEAYLRTNVHHVQEGFLRLVP